MHFHKPYLFYQCNYLPGKLTIKLSKFYQQALLAWKICFHHNFSPHKMLLWNNCLITSRNKSLFLRNWFEYLSWICLIKVETCHIIKNLCSQIISAIPNVLIHLMKSHLIFGSHERRLPELIVDGITNIFSFMK